MFRINRKLVEIKQNKFFCNPVITTFEEKYELEYRNNTQPFGIYLQQSVLLNGNAILLRFFCKHVRLTGGLIIDIQGRRDTNTEIFPRVVRHLDQDKKHKDSELLGRLGDRHEFFSGFDSNEKHFDAYGNSKW